MAKTKSNIYFIDCCPVKKNLFKFFSDWIVNNLSEYNFNGSFYTFFVIIIDQQCFYQMNKIYFSRVSYHKKTIFSNFLRNVGCWYVYQIDSLLLLFVPNNPTQNHMVYIQNFKLQVNWGLKNQRSFQCLHLVEIKHFYTIQQYLRN